VPLSKQRGGEAEVNASTLVRVGVGGWVCVRACMFACVCVFVCVCVCGHVCVHACVNVCQGMSVSVGVGVGAFQSMNQDNCEFLFQFHPPNPRHISSYLPIPS